MNKNGEDFTIVVVWFARACVMKEIKNMFCFNFAGKNCTPIANTNYSKILHI